MSTETLAKGSSGGESGSWMPLPQVQEEGWEVHEQECRQHRRHQRHPCQDDHHFKGLHAAPADGRLAVKQASAWP